MSSPDSEDVGNDLLAAKERDLKPLLRESADTLDLDGTQVLQMEAFLTEAWLAGTRCGHAQMRERAIQGRPDVRAVSLEQIEAEFKVLMEDSADALNLSVHSTIAMWSSLGQAWIAGAHTCEAEIMAMLIEAKSDIAEEARQWLEEESEG